MYTKLDDWKLANQIVEFLVANPMATQEQICERFRTNSRRLNQLETDHLINIKHTRRKHGATTSTQE